MPKTQRFAGDGLVRHGYRVPGTTKSDEISTQVGQKRVRTGRIGSAPMALGVEPRMLCISTRMGLLRPRACPPFLMLRPPRDGDLYCVEQGGYFVLTLTQSCLSKAGLASHVTGVPICSLRCCGCERPDSTAAPFAPLLMTECQLNAGLCAGRLGTERAVLPLQDAPLQPVQPQRLPCPLAELSGL